MNASSLKKKISFQDLFKSSQVLFKIAWQTDKRTVFLFFLTAFLGGLVALATSWVLKLLIDQLQAEQREALTTIPMIIVFTLVARYVVTLAADLLYQTYQINYLDYILRYKLQNAISLEYAKKLASLDVAHFENPLTQNLIRQVRNTMKWQIPDLMRLIGYVLRDAIAYLVAFVALLPFGWWIPFLITLITLPRLYLRSKYGALNWSLWGAGAPQMAKLYYYESLFADKVSIKEMRIAQSAPKLLRKFDAIQDYLLKLNKTALDTYVRVSILPPIVESACIVVIAYSFLGDVLSMSITIGLFTFLVSMLEQINGTSARVASHFGEIYENGLYLTDYVKVLNMEPLIPQPENPTPIDPSQSPKIEFKNVSFAYPNGTKVLHNVSFCIEPGESIALVGQNGAGKSTIISLLCRFYDVSEGQVLINGIDIRQIDLPTWYKTLGTLFQSYVQYHFTIRENIAFDNASAVSLVELQSAAQKSGAQEFIESMPQAYDQQLGQEFEGGRELSGGQWQKLAIARAFYNEPPVLILDEPTSAIDAEAEYEIFNNLEKQYRDKSLILVSHRFSTVRNADKIYVIDQGRIIEEGSHEALLKRQGKYAALFYIQAEGYH